VKGTELISQNAKGVTQLLQKFAQNSLEDMVKYCLYENFSQSTVMQNPKP